MPDPSSKIVTNHGEFYRATRKGETRYYTAGTRAEAFEFSEIDDPVIVMGFAVYDTTISSIYAVALYATVAEAEAHTPTPAPAKPIGVFYPEPRPQAASKKTGVFGKR
jgi:hypothetical protein